MDGFYFLATAIHCFIEGKGQSFVSKVTPGIGVTVEEQWAETNFNIFGEGHLVFISFSKLNYTLIIDTSYYIRRRVVVIAVKCWFKNTKIDIPSKPRIPSSEFDPIS